MSVSKRPVRIEVETVHSGREYRAILRDDNNIVLFRDGKRIGLAKWNEHHGMYTIPDGIPFDAAQKLELKLRQNGGTERVNLEGAAPNALTTWKQDGYLHFTHAPYGMWVIEQRRGKFYVELHVDKSGMDQDFGAHSSLAKAKAAVAKDHKALLQLERSSK